MREKQKGKEEERKTKREGAGPFNRVRSQVRTASAAVSPDVAALRKVTSPSWRNLEKMRRRAKSKEMEKIQSKMKREGERKEELTLSGGDGNGRRLILRKIKKETQRSDKRRRIGGEDKVEKENKI
jgi:transcriptional regulator of acetoin/glycerol metabolism